jgi:hypothetical protein
MLTWGLLAFLWRIGRLSASFGVLGGRGSGSSLTQEQMRAAAASVVCLREKGFASSSTACRLSRPALVWYRSG